jgi:hypothetical protein
VDTVTIEVRDNTLILPPEAGAKLGWSVDTKLHFKKDKDDFVLCPRELTADEIDDIACTYLMEYVGDATAVKTPILKNGKWHVEVVLSYRDETVGYLTLSRDGKILPEESDSPQKMKNKYR